MSYDRLDDVTENEDLFMRVDRSTCMVGRTGRIGSWKDNCATKDVRRPGRPHRAEAAAGLHGLDMSMR